MAENGDAAADRDARDDPPIGPHVPASPPRGRARMELWSRRTHRVLRDRWDVLAVIAAGGALGSLGRWGLTALLPHPVGTFPWATFTANVTGCLLLGALMVFVIDVLPPSRYVRPFLGVGVLGGYTTFSTYMLDARSLLAAGRTATAGQYVFGSLAAGLVAVWAGVTIARLVTRPATGRGARRREARRREARRATSAPPSAPPSAPTSPATPSAAGPAVTRSPR